MKSFLHILFFIFIITQSNYSQWNNQNPVPDENRLNSVFFTDDITGWIVGSGGLITKTTNAGIDWIPQNSGTTTDLSAVNFVDNNNGWAVGKSGLIIRTSNGGSEWIEQSSGTSIKLKAVHFYNSNLGWVVGYDGTILKTTDGGLNWNNIASGTTYPLFSINFIDDLTGWSVGGKTGFGNQLVVVLKTTDGGNNWFQQDLGLDSGYVVGGPLYSVHFIDSNIGWVVGANKFITKTTDGGATWNRQYFSNLFNEPVLQEDYIPGEDGIGGNLSVFFKDENLGWIVGGGDYYNVKKSRIVQTTDGGSNWYVTYYGPRTSWLSSVFVTSAGKGWAVGYNGSIYVSDENGASWDGQLSGNYARISSISFIDENTGWATGCRYDPDITTTQPIIMKTTNSGKIWESKFSKSWGFTQFQDLYSCIFFLDELNGWAVLDAVQEITGNVYRTTDGGENWALAVTAEENVIHSIFFIDQSIGWVIGSAGIYKSIDGGNTWIQKSSVEGSSVYFIDSNNGWIVGSNGIWKSTDGGETWVIKSSLAASYVRFYDANTGMCISTGGALLSTDGGETWIPKSGPNLQTINFTSSTTVWGYTSEGTIYKTTNAGDNWNQLNTGLGTGQNSFFISENTGWVASESSVFNYSNDPIPPTNHFTPVWSGNGYLQMDINILGADLIGGGGLIAGDEIGVFDGINCVGAVKLIGPINGTVQIIASTDDPNSTEIDGFINGHTISYKFWLSALAEEISDYTANYASGNGSFESEGTAIVDFTSVLPVELVSFTADLNDNKVRLSWQTATEINNYGFEVERKLNENDWNRLGFVEGYGNSSSPKSYLFTDNTLIGGNKFQYRLKQIDTDGQFNYSDIVEVEILPDSYELFQNYPNPFNPTTKIRYQLPMESKVVIKIYDILGSEVVTLLNEEKEPGSYEVEFNATSLSSGTYIYRIVAGDYVEMKKMVLMK